MLQWLTDVVRALSNGAITNNLHGLEGHLNLFEHFYSVSQKNRTATINMTYLHQFTTFSNCFWHRDLIQFSIH